jgi:hypothetical protein
MSLGTDWVRTGQGNLPRQRWSFATDAPLTDLSVAREQGDILAADESGGLYRLDRMGRIQSLTRTSHQIRSVAMADDGSAGVALLDEQTLAWFDPNLQFRWTRALDDEAIAVAITALGTHAVVTLGSGMNVIYDADKRKVTNFKTLRPLRYVEFIVGEAALVGAADYGFFAKYAFSGDPVWSERLFSTVNDLTVTGDGSAIILAALAHGLQAYDGDGTAQGNFVLDGTVHRVSATFGPKRIAAGTHERQLLVIEHDGNLRCGVTCPEDIQTLKLSPHGDWICLGFQDGHIVRLDL